MRTTAGALRGALRQGLAQIGQIYFQPSAATGLVILAALAWVRPWAAAGMGIGSLAALAVSRISPRGRSRESVRSGLWGYNASLTGAGLLTLYAPGPAVILYLLGVSVASALLTARWLAWGRLPALTGQFVLAMWGARALAGLFAGQLTPPGCAGGALALWPCGIGQVTFIAGAAAGLAVWVAILVHSRRDGVWLGIGAAAGVLLSQGFQAHLPLLATEQVGLAVNLGLIAQGLAVFERRIPVRLFGLAAGAALCLLLARLRVPYFTLPFNLVVWALLSVTTAAARARPVR